MTQQVDYNSSNLITADPRLIRRLRWGVFIGIIAGAITLLYGLAVCVYVLSRVLGIVLAADYIPEPPTVFGMTLVFLVPSAWLLTKATKPRSLLVFLEMLFARIGLALLIAGLWNEYGVIADLLDRCAIMLGVAWGPVQPILLVFVAWNMVIWAVLHLAARNVRLVGLQKYAQAVTIWLSLVFGLPILVTAVYVAIEYSSFYGSALDPYWGHLLFGLLVIILCLLLMIEILAIVTSRALRRIKKEC